MKMNRLTAYLLWGSLLFGASASAQQLTTRIRGEYADSIVIPAASRLPFTPALPTTPTGGQKYLSYSLQSLSVAVPSSYATLEPAAIADTLATISSRGYARLGLMSIFNVDASAGYKILDTDRTRLSAWLQYDASTYRGCYTRDQGFGTRFVHNHAATIGTTLHQAVGRESFIDAGLDYTYGHNTVGALKTDNPYATDGRTTGRLNASALWTQRHRALDFGVGADYHYLHIANPIGKVPNENRIGGTAFIRGAFAGSSAAGLTATVSHQSFTSSVDRAADVFWSAPVSKSNTLLTLNPYYRLDLNNIHLDLGAKVNLTFGAGKFFHIAPDVKAVWVPSSIVKIYGSATGGVRQNTLSSMLDAAPYLTPAAGARPSNIPFEVTLGATIGSWHGLYANIFASYSHANDWLMPLQDPAAGYCSFNTVNLKGYRLHVGAGYSFKDIATVEAFIEKAPGKQTRGYYLWLDRATTVAGADLTVRPIRPLSVTIGWDFRSGRSVATVDALSAAAPATTTLRGLGTISKLRASASYAVTKKLTIEGSIDNILNRSFMLPGLIPGQGITGLIGASYQF